MTLPESRSGVKQWRGQLEDKNGSVPEDDLVGKDAVSVKPLPAFATKAKELTGIPLRTEQGLGPAAQEKGSGDEHRGQNPAPDHGPQAWMPGTGQNLVLQAWLVGQSGSDDLNP